jgi:hypothetical protein
VVFWIFHGINSANPNKPGMKLKQPGHLAYAVIPELPKAASGDL